MTGLQDTSKAFSTSSTFFQFYFIHPSTFTAVFNKFLQWKATNSYNFREDVFLLLLPSWIQFVNRFRLICSLVFHCPSSI